MRLRRPPTPIVEAPAPHPGTSATAAYLHDLTGDTAAIRRHAGNLVIAVQGLALAVLAHAVVQISRRGAQP